MTTRKKKKKQPNTSHQQDERTRMNVFYRKLYTILAQYQCEEVVNLMTKSLKRAFYELRTPPSRFQRLDCPDISPKQYKSITDMVTWGLQNFYVALNEGGPEVSLHEFFTIGQNLRLLQEATRINAHVNGEQIHELLSTRLNLQEALLQAIRKLTHICRFASAFYSSYASYTVTVHADMPDQLKNNHVQGLQFLIGTHKVPVHYFNVNKHLRPAFRIAIPLPDLQISWLSMNRALFDQTPFQDQEQVPVYIQSHAFQRLEQRLDLVANGDLYFHTCISIQQATVIRYKRYHLIEFIASNCKLGYLVADLVEGKILIKTFLFLASDGTPEGEKLEQLCGLTKVDMKYLKIDHLSAFYHSDIKDDPRLKKLFIDAGCESLFKFCEQEIDKPCRHDQLSSYILQYIQLDQDKELPAIAG